MPFKDVAIHLHNFLITILELGIDSPIGLAVVSSISCVVVLGGLTFATVYIVTGKPDRKSGV